MNKYSESVSIERIESYARKKDIEYEFYLVNSNDKECDIFNDNIDYVTSGRQEGFSIRTIVDGNIGMASTNNLIKYKECIDSAVKIANISKQDQFSPFSYPKKGTKVKTFDKSLIDISSEDIHNLIEEIKHNLKDKDKNIRISKGCFTKSFSTRTIINSNGVDISEDFCSNSLNIESLTLPGTDTLSIETGVVSNKPITPDSANGWAERLLSLKNKQAMNGVNSMPVILHREALAQIFAAVLEPSINAERIIEKKSKLNIGDAICDERINIVDDATIDMGLGSYNYDGEGTPGKRTDIINKGELKSFLHNNYSSAKLDMENTGNAWRSMSTKPYIESSNLVMQGGNKDILDTENCLFVREIMGAHTIDKSSGTFSLGAVESFLVKDGKRTAVKDTMIAGNFYQMMKSIIEIGNDQKSCYSSSGYYLPSILVDGINIIGQ
ncbi:TldD/PmbA family protein [Candidatus Woesearchaeota archaeon]|nr:TldD/PmbA family protein [Candidatus Woesearchaeota archaeon]